jgi:hypothetical protein
MIGPRPTNLSPRSIGLIALHSHSGDLEAIFTTLFGRTIIVNGVSSAGGCAMRLRSPVGYVAERSRDMRSPARVSLQSS